MRILIDHGAYHNLGDIAMLEGVVCRLLSILPRAQISVIDRGFVTKIWHLDRVSRQANYLLLEGDESNRFREVPFFGRRIPGIDSRIKLMFLGSLLSASSISLANRGKAKSGRMKLAEFCEGFDALHISGGGNLTDEFCIELFRRCSLMLAFAEQGKPVVLTGQQLGPFRVRLFRKALSGVLRRANFVGIREPGASLTFCQEAHLAPERFDVMGDDSFGIPSAQDSLVSNLLAQYGLVTNHFLAFNIRVSRAGKEHAKYLPRIAELMDKAASQLQMPIAIVPTSLEPGGSDVETGKKLAELAHRADIVILENDSLAPELIKGVLGKAFGAVGVSYHFCTFTLSQGVPAVCIYDGDYYTQKARGLCGFWEDERLALPLKDINTDLAVHHIMQAFEDEDLRRKLGLLAHKATERWRNIFDKQVNSAFGRLGGIS